MLFSNLVPVFALLASTGLAAPMDQSHDQIQERGPNKDISAGVNIDIGGNGWHPPNHHFNHTFGAPPLPPPSLSAASGWARPTDYWHHRNGSFPGHAKPTGGYAMPTGSPPNQHHPMGTASGTLTTPAPTASASAGAVASASAHS